jgi:hypothetical protein
LRHRDEVTAVVFVIIGVAGLGLGVGHAFYTRRRSCHRPPVIAPVRCRMFDLAPVLMSGGR